MVVNAGWLIFGIFAIAAAAFFTVFIERRVFDPEGLVKAVREHMKAQQGTMADPDARGVECCHRRAYESLGESCDRLSGNRDDLVCRSRVGIKLL
jgi:hypothetical protein